MLCNVYWLGQPYVSLLALVWRILVSTERQHAPCTMFFDPTISWNNIIFPWIHAERTKKNSLTSVLYLFLSIDWFFDGGVSNLSLAWEIFSSLYHTDECWPNNIISPWIHAENNEKEGLENIFMTSESFSFYRVNFWLGDLSLCLAQSNGMLSSLYHYLMSVLSLCIISPHHTKAR